MIATNKKPTFPIVDKLRRYLVQHRREMSLPVVYQDLMRFQGSVPLLDNNGRETLWETVFYDQTFRPELFESLTYIYALLKVDGDLSVMKHLYVDRVDYCTFGNSCPFRIRIVNSFNDNQDYYYVKKADASRIYGLELEHLLSPNRMNFFSSGDTLIEEHVVGIPGDIFIDNWLESNRLKPVRVAKELVKFNERCFIRLLGDMRSYNFVVDVTPDFEETQIRLRPMDFDQQSYSGIKNFYLPQFFRENNKLALYCIKHLNPTTAYQYQREEQTLIFKRMNIIKDRLATLLQAMTADNISTPEKVSQLRESLAEHYQNTRFIECKNMGEVVSESLNTMVNNLNRPGKTRKPLLDWLPAIRGNQSELL